MESIPRVLTVCLASISMLACALFGSPQPTPGALHEPAADESPAPNSFTLVVLHPSQGELSVLLAEHAQRAVELERRPFAEFSADWCPPCHALADSLGDARMIEAFRGTYIIRLDIDEWERQLSGTDFIVLGVPAFYELNRDGTPADRSITGAAWGQDIPENMAPPLQAFFRGESQ